MTTLPVIKLDRGLHALHLFYRVDRERWAQSAQCLAQLEALCAANAQPSHPRLTTYATIGGKADLAFFLLAAELGQVSPDAPRSGGLFSAGRVDAGFFLPERDGIERIHVQRRRTTAAC